MKTLFLLLFLSSCSSPQKWDFVKSSHPDLLKYHSFFQDDSRYPINFVKGVDYIRINYDNYVDETGYFSTCYQSKIESERVVLINPSAFKQVKNQYIYLLDDYDKRDRFLAHLSKIEYYQYKIILFSLSYCLNYGENESEVLKHLP